MASGSTSTTSAERSYKTSGSGTGRPPRRPVRLKRRHLHCHTAHSRRYKHRKTRHTLKNRAQGSVHANTLFFRNFAVGNHITFPTAMIFNSLTYAIFFHRSRTASNTSPALPEKQRTIWQNLLLLAASYFFYGWWDWRFLRLIIFSTALTYACANTTTKRRLWCTIGISANVAILVLFKYFSFFGEGLAPAARRIRMDSRLEVTVDILLPVGISFAHISGNRLSGRLLATPYSAMHISGRLRPFHILLPATRCRTNRTRIRHAPRFAATRRWNPARATEGLRLILWGIFKKSP